MNLKLEKRYFVTKQGKDISGKDWEGGQRIYNSYIVLEKIQKNKFMTIAIFSEETGDCTFQLNDVFGYNVSFNGLIVYKRCQNKDVVMLYDFDGNVIIPAGYDKIAECPNHQDLYYVKKDEKTGVFDSNGKEIIPVKYDNYEETFYGFKFSDAKLCYLKGLYFIYSNKLIEPMYINIEETEGFIITINENFKSELLAYDACNLLKKEYDGICLKKVKDQIIFVVTSKENDDIFYGVYKIEAKKVVCLIEPKKSIGFVYDFGIGIIEKNNEEQLEELFDFDGKKLLPGKYDSIIEIENEKLIARKGDMYFIYTKQGKLIHSERFNNILREVEENLVYYKFVTLNSRTFLYIPRVNAFVEGYYVRDHLTDEITYLNKDEKWVKLSKEEYDNANKISSLNDYGI